MRRATAGVAALPAVLTAIRLAGWWPCDVACQGGGFYQRLGGIDILWPALIGYLVLSGLALFDGFRRPRWSAATCLVAGLLGGASLFYLWVAWSLELLCPFCLTLHGLVLLVVVAVAPDAALAATTGLVLGALGLNAAFHHRVQADVVEGAGSETALRASEGARERGSEGERMASAADANRVRGSDRAAITVEYGYALQCSHCAQQHGPLLDALGPALQAGTIRLVLRPVVRPADAGSVWLARWAFAAAATSPAALDRFLIERLDTRAALSRTELLTLGGDLPALDAAAADGRFDALVDTDQVRLKQLGYKGATPFVAIVRDGQVRARFVRDVPLADLAAVIAREDALRASEGAKERGSEGVEKQQ